VRVRSQPLDRLQLQLRVFVPPKEKAAREKVVRAITKEERVTRPREAKVVREAKVGRATDIMMTIEMTMEMEMVLILWREC